jgi:phospho-2-dehydro-3-deoxyheptonate aldolase
LVVVGPCSIHDVKAAKEYGKTFYMTWIRCFSHASKH